MSTCSSLLLYCSRVQENSLKFHYSHPHPLTPYHPSPSLQVRNKLHSKYISLYTNKSRHYNERISSVSLPLAPSLPLSLSPSPPLPLSPSLPLSLSPSLSPYAFFGFLALGVLLSAAIFLSMFVSKASATSFSVPIALPNLFTK